MPLSKLEKKEHCCGCQDDYYNYGNNSTTGECWMLKTAKLVKRYKIGWWTPMDKASNFSEVKVLSCYHDLKNGHGNAYCVVIPSHLKLEWDKLQKDKKAKTK